MGEIRDRDRPMIYVFDKHSLDDEIAIEKEKETIIVQAIHFIELHIVLIHQVR